MGPLNFHLSPLSTPWATACGLVAPAVAAGSEALLDAEAEEAVGDALAEDGSLHVIGVGVEDVVVTGETSEDHDVRFSDGASGRSELLTDGEILEEGAGMSAHEGVG